MYILYGNIEGWAELDKTNDEMEIVDDIGYYISNGCEINFIVKKQMKDTDIIHKTITTHKQYIKYLREVTDKYMENKKAQGKVKKLTKKK